MKHLTITNSSPLLLNANELSTVETNWTLFNRQQTNTENDTLLRYLSHSETTIETGADISYKEIVGLPPSSGRCQIR